MLGSLQAVYFATKAYMTSFSNVLWRELKDTGVTVTALVSGAMQTGFASTGGLLDTKLFANAVSSDAVAKDGYEGMLKGKLLLLDCWDGRSQSSNSFMEVIKSNQGQFMASKVNLSGSSH